jgi:hypothetical protein
MEEGDTTAWLLGLIYTISVTNRQGEILYQMLSHLNRRLSVSPQE